MVVEGAAGSGKTRLVEAAAAEARRQGFRVVSLPDGADCASTVIDVLDDAARGRPVVIVDDRHPIGSDRAALITSIVSCNVSELPVLALVTQTAPPGHIERSAWVPSPTGRPRACAFVRSVPVQ